MKFEFNINLTVQPSSEMLKRLDEIQRSIRTIMGDIHDVEADVAQLTTVAESAEALLDGLSQ